VAAILETSTHNRKETIMRKQSMLAILILVALGAPGPVRANGGVDPMRCEARRMRCDSRRFDCLVRCDRRSSQPTQVRADANTSPQDDCASACEKRAGVAMARIENNPPCVSNPVPGEPRMCEARLLRLGAEDLVCTARCSSQALRDSTADSTTCLQDCATRCIAMVNTTLASPICSDGRVGTDPICAIQ